MRNSRNAVLAMWVALASLIALGLALVALDADASRWRRAPKHRLCSGNVEWYAENAPSCPVGYRIEWSLPRSNARGSIPIEPERCYEARYRRPVQHKHFIAGRLGWTARRRWCASSR